MHVGSWATSALIGAILQVNATNPASSGAGESRMAELLDLSGFAFVSEGLREDILRGMD